MTTLENMRMRADPSSIARALADRAEEVAAALLGEPSSKSAA